MLAVSWLQLLIHARAKNAVIAKANIDYLACDAYLILKFTNEEKRNEWFRLLRNPRH